MFIITFFAFLGLYSRDVRVQGAESRPTAGGGAGAVCGSRDRPMADH